MVSNELQHLAERFFRFVADGAFHHAIFTARMKVFRKRFQTLPPRVGSVIVPVNFSCLLILHPVVFIPFPLLSRMSHVEKTVIAYHHSQLSPHQDRPFHDVVEFHSRDLFKPESVHTLLRQSRLSGRGFLSEAPPIQYSRLRLPLLLSVFLSATRHRDHQ